jgi:hypothetical protein
MRPDGPLQGCPRCGTTVVPQAVSASATLYWTHCVICGRDVHWVWLDGTLVPQAPSTDTPHPERQERRS